MVNRLLAWLGRDVSGASLGVFRATFGAVLLYEASYFLKPSFFFWPERGANLVQRLYTGDHLQWHFHYPGFSWVRPLPEPWTSVVFGLFALAAALVAVGWWYRAAIVVLWAAFTYVILMEAAWYLNHFYLGSLLAFLLIWMPADRRWSLRRLWATRATRAPLSLPDHVPFWCVFLLRFQLFVMYFYAGIAKLTPDWLAGEPVRMWLGDAFVGRRLEWVVGPEAMVPIRHLLRHEAVVYFIAYGGLIFDLLIGPMLLWRRTRWLALALVAFFHGTNFLLFDIGAFPVMAFLLTLIFFDPDWPDRLWSRLRGLVVQTNESVSLKSTPPPHHGGGQPAIGGPRLSRGGAVAIATWVIVQLLLPFRHFAIAGNVHWTGEGSRFSWHMMLRHHEPGYLEFRVVDPQLVRRNGDHWQVDWSRWKHPADESSWHEVDVRQLDLTTMPELFITYEPIVGERLFYNPLAQEARAPESPHPDPTEHLTSMWQTAFHRRPLIKKLTRLSESLEKLRNAAARSHIEHGTPSLGAVRRAALAAELAKQLEQSTLDEQSLLVRTAQLQTVLQELRSHRVLRKALLDALDTAPPWAVLGGRLSDDHIAAIVAVRDRALERRNAHRGGKRHVSRRGPKGDMSAFLDLRRLLPIEMAALPQTLIVWDAQQQPRIVWNYASELHPLQCRTMRSYACMQHEYAQHIAQQWQASYGRRPQVYVRSSLALNHHPLQPLIDPTVDLASVPRYVWRHNEWILPMQRRATAPNDRMATNRPSPGAAP